MKHKSLIHVKVKGVKGAKAKKWNAILTKEFNGEAVIGRFMLGQRNLILYGRDQDYRWIDTKPKTP
jgi:hypothetical protein